MSEFEKAENSAKTAEVQQLPSAEEIRNAIVMARDWVKAFSIGIRGNVTAGLCPPWPHRVERSCMLFSKGACQYLVNPSPALCMHCWERSMKRPDMLPELKAGKYAEKENRFSGR